MMKRALLLLTFCVFIISAFKEPEEGYFASPLDRSIYLSGTFGELRPGHFHAGIDIKSLNGSPGEKVLASAPGYVARIKVSPYGYGNALYIAHPNGYTTVYAHLDRFIPEIADYIKEKQYASQKFAVELYPRADQFKVIRGQHIGYLGNSGGSFGPHLHFEIRRTADQVPINPLKQGISIRDQRPPEITGLRIYHMDDALYVTNIEEYTPQLTSTGSYTLSDTIWAGAWRVAFGIATTDRMDAVPNRNGIYDLQMDVDGDLQYGFTMNEVPFSKARYLNAHIDYAVRQTDRKYFNLCYRQPGNILGFYREGPDKGITKLFADKPRNVHFKVLDASGNSAELDVVILRDTEMSATTVEKGEYLVLPKESLAISKQGFKASIPEGSVYTPTYVNCSVNRAEMPDSQDTFTLGLDTQPLHKYMSIELATAGIPTGLLDKAAVALIERPEEDNPPELTSLGGEYINGSIKSKSRAFGEFTIIVDTVAPIITPVQFETSMVDDSRMRFRITDNFNIGGRAKGLSYRAECDGEWILMEYDAKNDMLTHWFDQHIAKGEHTLRLVVTDDRKNVAVFEGAFVR